MENKKAGITTVLRQHEASWINWGTLQCNLHWIYEGQVKKEHLYGTFSTRSIAAWFLEKGSLRVTRNAKTIDVPPGNWIILLPGTFLQEFAPDSKLLSIRFDINWPDNKQLFDQDVTVVFPDKKYPEVTRRVHAVIKAAKEVIQTKDPFDLELSQVVFPKFIRIKAELWFWIEQLYIALLSEGVYPSRVGIRDNRVAKILQILREMPLDQPFRLAHVAGQVGLGKSRLSQLFLEQTGVTPSQYMNNRRFDYARRMIENPAVQIKQIAYDLGFTRLSDFSFWFKTHSESSPRTYRANMQQKPG